MNQASSGDAVAPGLLLVAPLQRLAYDFTGLLRRLTEVFRREARLHPMAFDLDLAYEPRRNQYHSTRLLLEMEKRWPPGAERLVGLVDVDLFVPVLTYVFGEAQLGGHLAVVSTFRLREPWLPNDVPPSLLDDRVQKTTLHELGHTVGLIHCPDIDCVMASASSLEMLDEKGGDFCLSCRAKIARTRW